MVGDARHWRYQPFYAIHKKLQWQFLESLCEDKFVMQLGSHGMRIDYITTFFVFKLMRNA